VSRRDVIRAYERERKARWREHKAAFGADSTKGHVPINPVVDLGIVGPKHGLKIAVIPDAQVMPGVDMRHLRWAGQYIAEKRPDAVVCIGDFGDFPSLSQFGRKREFEGRRYKKDLAAFHQGMEFLMEPIEKAPGYDPYLEFTDGNHETHIERYVNDDPRLEGMMSIDDLKLKDYGWREHPFLQPISIGGVAFCHYFPSGVMGRPITTGVSLLRMLHMSAFAGHQQGRDIAFGRRADGGHMTAIISGSFYQHSYSYLSPFTNAHWRGMWMLHEVKDGAFDEMALSINFLKRKFG
jgi:hypothetical protein